MAEEFLSAQQLAVVASPFRGARANRLVEKLRGARWTVDQGFGNDHQPYTENNNHIGNVDAGNLSDRRLRSNAWAPWKHNSCSSRSRALPSFSTCDAQGAIAMPTLGKHLIRGDSGDTTDHSISRASSAIAAEAELGMRFEDSDERIRWRTARGLSALGEGAVVGTNASLLTERLNADVDATVRWAVAEALGRGGPSTAVANGSADALVRRLADYRRPVRWEASDALARIDASGLDVIVPVHDTLPPMRIKLRSDGRWH